MIDLEDNSRILSDLKNRIEELIKTIDINKLKNNYEDLKSQTMNENFWQDSNNSVMVLTKLKSIEKKINLFNNLKSNINNLIETNLFLKDEYDEDLAKDLIRSTDNLLNDVDKLEMQSLFKGKYDNNNVIVTIHPGAGGTESHDWAEMLYRMYTRWATQNGFEIEELDVLYGDEAGIKCVTFEVRGDQAYGYMKSEHGVHRLIRISPFDSNSRRHTSFASVEVLPEISDDVDLEINPDDLRIDTYRASGAGGQHINKTSSAVRITHIPTNIVVQCQTQRSQIQNKETCMKMLKSKLLDLKEKENKEKIEDLKGVQMDIAWGSQIRSYVFCPYTMVKDHRTNYEVGNVQSVMDGNLNNFMLEYLKFINR